MITTLKLTQKYRFYCEHCQWQSSDKVLEYVQSGCTLHGLAKLNLAQKSPDCPICKIKTKVQYIGMPLPKRKWFHI